MAAGAEEAADVRRAAVICRVRPVDSAAVAQGGGVGATWWNMRERRVRVWHGRGSASFAEATVDTLLGPSAAQMDVYDAVGRRAVEAVARGRDACVVAVGGASSGKSFSLFGPSATATAPGWDGVVPRMLSHLGTRLRLGESASEAVVVAVQALEMNGRGSLVDMLNLEPGRESERVWIGENTEGELVASGVRTVRAESTSALVSIGRLVGALLQQSFPPLPGSQPSLPGLPGGASSLSSSAGGGGGRGHVVLRVIVRRGSSDGVEANLVVADLSSVSSSSSSSSSLSALSASSSAAPFLTSRARRLLQTVPRDEASTVSEDDEDRGDEVEGGRHERGWENGASAGMAVVRDRRAPPSSSSSSLSAFSSAQSSASTSASLAVLSKVAEALCRRGDRLAAAERASAAAGFLGDGAWGAGAGAGAGMGTGVGTAGDAESADEALRGLLLSGAAHVPFRESPLTRVLQPALEGDAVVSLLVCCDPSAAAADDTRAALRLALQLQRALDLPLAARERRPLHWAPAAWPLESLAPVQPVFVHLARLAARRAALDARVVARPAPPRPSATTSTPSLSLAPSASPAPQWRESVPHRLLAARRRPAAWHWADRDSASDDDSHHSSANGRDAAEHDVRDVRDKDDEDDEDADDASFLRQLGLGDAAEDEESGAEDRGRRERKKRTSLEDFLDQEDAVRRSREREHGEERQEPQQPQQQQQEQVHRRPTDKEEDESSGVDGGGSSVVDGFAELLGAAAQDVSWKSEEEEDGVHRRGSAGALHVVESASHGRPVDEQRRDSEDAVFLKALLGELEALLAVAVEWEAHRRVERGLPRRSGGVGKLVEGEEAEARELNGLWTQWLGSIRDEFDDRVAARVRSLGGLPQEPPVEEEEEEGERERTLDDLDHFLRDQDLEPLAATGEARAPTEVAAVAAGAPVAPTAPAADEEGAPTRSPVPSAESGEESEMRVGLETHVLVVAARSLVGVEWREEGDGLGAVCIVVPPAAAAAGLCVGDVLDRLGAQLVRSWPHDRIAQGFRGTGALGPSFPVTLHVLRLTLSSTSFLSSFSAAPLPAPQPSPHPPPQPQPQLQHPQPQPSLPPRPAAKRAEAAAEAEEEGGDGMWGGGEVSRVPKTAEDYLQHLMDDGAARRPTLHAQRPPPRPSHPLHPSPPQLVEASSFLGARPTKK